MSHKEYKVTISLPLFGIGGVVFFTYVILYTADVVPWKVFPRMKDISIADDNGEFGLLVFFDVVCLFLIWAGRLKVTLDETGIMYKGVLHSLHMRWTDITRANVDPRGRTIELWTKRKHLSIPTMIFTQSDLRTTIIDCLKNNSPDVEISESPLPFWPRRRTRKE